MPDPFREALAAVVSEAKCATEAGYRLADFMPLEAARAACRNLYDEAVRRADQNGEACNANAERLLAARAEADRLRDVLRRLVGLSGDLYDAKAHADARALLAPAPDGAAV
jgi:hypothetical protein